MDSLPINRKRSSPAPQHPWQRPNKDHRRHQDQFRPRPTEGVDDSLAGRKEHETFAREQTRRNQIQEAEQMKEWVSKEDEFVLKQSKKKAKIRVKEGRAKTIDWLAVTLSVIDPTRDPLEDDTDEPEAEIVNPAGMLEGLSNSQLHALVMDIENYMTLETNPKNRGYWKALKIICRDRQNHLSPTVPQDRLVNHAVSTDVDRLLGPKSFEQLTTLEKQIHSKLQSNEPIDVEYWEQLLRSIAVYKAKAELDEVYKSIIQGRMTDLRLEQKQEAELARDRLSVVLGSVDASELSPSEERLPSDPQVVYSQMLDPEPHLKLSSDDKALDVVKEEEFVDRIATDRHKVVAMGYVPLRQLQPERAPTVAVPKQLESNASTTSRFATVPNEDFSQATTALYEREVARGVQEDEEIFAGEEEVATNSKPQWASKYRPRKPRYFNRVQMGYEWNKYNQTHYDHENPPPKVVQGYKFNIFYPDLIDKVKAPTYRIEREGGRKRGQSFAPAGEEDTCLIRFVSGPPYEDLAFRIVDKEWDYSAKRERGFRSSFDKGILQLHFQFKKVYYRK